MSNNKIKMEKFIIKKNLIKKNGNIVLQRSIIAVIVDLILYNK